MQFISSINFYDGCTYEILMEKGALDANLLSDSLAAVGLFFFSWTNTLAIKT